MINFRLQMARSIEDEKEIGFEWFRTSKIMVYDSMQRIFQRKRNFQSVLGLFDPKQRAFSEMPLCEAILSLTLPTIFSVNDEGHAYYPFMGKYFHCGHFYAETNSDLILCIAFGQFVSPAIAHARPFDRITQIQQTFPDSIRFDRNLGVAVLIEEREKIRQKMRVEYC